MIILSLVFFIVTAASELLFCVLRLKLPARIVQLLIAPALLLCFLSINDFDGDLWIIGALIFETIFNVVLVVNKLSDKWAEPLMAICVALFTAGCYINGLWAFVAPHINFTVFLVYITLLIIVFFRIYANLPQKDVFKTCFFLLYMCVFPACATIGVFSNMKTSTILIAVGALLALVHYAFTLLFSNRILNMKLGEFGAMALYITSRVLLVFGFQLAL
ncbi:MAG: hypothetical protein GXX89_01795 [Clostridiales bacterium]|nr:hypothetical protein [Clostridiales bacterium]